MDDEGQGSTPGDEPGEPIGAGSGTTTATATTQPGQWPRRWPIRKTRGEARKVEGVCGGIAVAANVDPKLVRVLMVLSMLSGWGIAVYIVLAVVLPRETDEDPASPLPGDQQLAARIGLGVAALLVLGDLADGWPFGRHGPGLGLVLVAVGGAVLWARRRTGPRSDSPTWPAPDPTTITFDIPSPWASPVPTAPLGSGIDWRSTGRDLLRLLGAFVAIGAALCVAAVTVLVATGGLRMQNPVAALLVAVAGLLGLILAVRRGRLAGMVASVGILGLAAVIAASQTSFPGGAGDRTFAYRAGEPIPRTIEHGAGDVRVDLTSATIPDGTSLAVRLGAGRATIVLPSGPTVIVRVRVGAGHATVFEQRRSGPGIDLRTTGEGLRPTMHLDVEVGVGEAVVVRDLSVVGTTCSVPSTLVSTADDPVRCVHPSAYAEDAVECAVQLGDLAKPIAATAGCARPGNTFDRARIADGTMVCTFPAGSDAASSCTAPTARDQARVAGASSPPAGRVYTCSTADAAGRRTCSPTGDQASAPTAPPATVVCAEDRRTGLLVCP